MLRHLIFLVATLCLAGCATPRADYTQGQSNVCEIHQGEMEKANVPIYYGLMRLTPLGKAYVAASTKAFPHAEQDVDGGCIVSREREAVIYVCPQCAKARRQWEADYHAAD